MDINASRKAIALDPNLALAHSNLGAALGAKGEIDAAIRELEVALSLDPNSKATEHSLEIAQNMKQAKKSQNGETKKLRNLR